MPDSIPQELKEGRKTREEQSMYAQVHMCGQTAVLFLRDLQHFLSILRKNLLKRQHEAFLWKHFAVQHLLTLPASS